MLTLKKLLRIQNSTQLNCGALRDLVAEGRLKPATLLK